MGDRPVDSAAKTCPVRPRRRRAATLVTVVLALLLPLMPLPATPAAAQAASTSLAWQVPLEEGATSLQAVRPDGAVVVPQTCHYPAVNTQDLVGVSAAGEVNWYIPAMRQTSGFQALCGYEGTGIEFDQENNTYLLEHNALGPRGVRAVSYSAGGERRWTSTTLHDSQPSRLTALGADGQFYAVVENIAEYGRQHLIGFGANGAVTVDAVLDQYVYFLFPYADGLVLGGLNGVEYRRYDGSLESSYDVQVAGSREFNFAAGEAGSVYAFRFADDCQGYSGGNTWPYSDAVGGVEVLRVTPAAGVTVKQRLGGSFHCTAGAEIVALPGITASDGSAQPPSVGAVLRLLDRDLGVVFVAIGNQGNELWRRPLTPPPDEAPLYWGLSPFHIDVNGVTTTTYPSVHDAEGQRLRLVQLGRGGAVVRDESLPGADPYDVPTPTAGRIYFASQAVDGCGPQCLKVVDVPGLAEDYIRRLRRFDEPPAAKRQYVALGDSVAAGEGLNYDWRWKPNKAGTDGKWVGSIGATPVWYPASDAEAQSCHRAAGAYPQLVAQQAGLRLRHLACTGASAQNGVLGRQSFGDRRPAPRYAQLGSSLPSPERFGYGPPNPIYDGSAPDIVTLTLGANDISFAAVVTRCYLIGKCHQRAEIRGQVFESLRTQKANLRAVLAEIQRRGTAAGKVPEVLVTTYFDPFPRPYRSCRDTYAGSIGLVPGEAKWLRARLGELNANVRSVTGEFPILVSVVGLGDVMRGHEWCSRTPWVYGASIALTDLTSPAPFHPTAAGQRAIAGRVANATQARLPTSN